MKRPGKRCSFTRVITGTGWCRADARAAAPATAQPAPPLQRRRLFMTAGGAVLLTALVHVRPARAASAAPHAMPRALLDLDTAASALFDAAEAERWADAHKAIVAAQTAALAVADLEARYTEAGGRLERFFAATNQLTSDLIDARAAESVRDRPWLVSSADNLLARVGDLTEPFAARVDAALPRVEVLLALARRMRRAPVWEDTTDFAAARDAFDRLWPAVRAELVARQPEGVRQVDLARARITSDPTSRSARPLYAAVRALLADLAPVDPVATRAPR